MTVSVLDAFLLAATPALCMFLVFNLICGFLYIGVKIRQKTRIPQERRMYAGARPPRPSSLATQEPTIYVSPSNFPPPPKYECMAPPSYEEVVGVHYPHQQPITQPITTVMRTESETRNNATSSTDMSPATVVTVSANERRTSVNVATSA